MASRSSSRAHRTFRAIVCALVAAVLWPTGAAVLARQAASTQSSPAERARAVERASDRIRTLLREADALASQQSKLLVELRKLETDRLAKADEVARVDRDVKETQRKLAETGQRIDALRKTADEQRPDVEARLLQLYKMGRAGYWRLLLDVDDLRSMGRAYRSAAAMMQIDRERVQAHQRTLESLAHERKELESRLGQLGTLQEQGRRARGALDRAVAAHTALVDSIDARRDLNAQMTSELQAAQQRLQTSLTQPDVSGPAPISLPVEAFQGALPWPVHGTLLSRFGRQTTTRFGTGVVRNGIEIAVPEGARVTAVHEGTVAYADQFTGYGNLVIVEHGEGAFSLYGHLASMNVSRGNRVEAGTPVGVSGRNPNGNPSVYFELRIDGRPVDPLQWLQKGSP